MLASDVMGKKKNKKHILRGIVMTLQERVNIVLDMCNREIDRQEVLMRCAEHNDDDYEWLKHFDLQGVYMMVRDILSSNFEL